ncbi:MAG TPA: hypothetical protein DF966_18215 [Sulfitobacter sp.]|nr:hypothetical protein [Sulfitobacter sp.]
MNLRDITAAIKAAYRPIFHGEIEKEVQRLSLVSEETRAIADEVTGAGRAITAMTEGKGE